MTGFSSRLSQKKNPTIVICGLIVVIATALALSVFGLARDRYATAVPGEEAPASPAVNAQPNQERVEVELVTVRRDGMEPKEITRPVGKFVLAVDNRSGAPRLDLQLEGGPGRMLLQSKIPFKKLSWKKSLNLPPGTYTLSEASHPDWVCRITITAR